MAAGACSSPAPAVLVNALFGGGARELTTASRAAAKGRDAERREGYVALVCVEPTGRNTTNRLSATCGSLRLSLYARLFVATYACPLCTAL